VGAGVAVLVLVGFAVGSTTVGRTIAVEDGTTTGDEVGDFVRVPVAVPGGGVGVEGVRVGVGVSVEVLVFVTVRVPVGRLVWIDVLVLVVLRVRVGERQMIVSPSEQMSWA
jgi:hypothetical protein